MRIVFMGTPDFAVPSLDMLVREKYDVQAVITQPDRPKGRGNRLSAPPVKEYALKAGIRVLQPEKVRVPGFYAQLKEMQPDLLVTVAYGRILPVEVLDIPPLGCINVHASLLPRYRGAAPIHWAIINDEKITGVTTMYTDAGMDTGDILLKREIEITDEMTTGVLSEKLSHMGAAVLTETLKKLERGTLVRIPQPSEGATYAPAIMKEAGRIDWTRPSRDIHNLVRGMEPYPGAYTLYRGKRMRVWKTVYVENNGRCNIPGTIEAMDGGALIVSTGAGIIEISEIQFDSSRRMSIREYLRGHKIDEGEILG